MSGNSLDQFVPRIRRAIAAERAALHEPDLAGAEWIYTKECLDMRWISSVGKMVERFEAMLCQATGVNHATAVVNGTAALHMCALLAGVRPGDEVIVPAFSFVATANAVAHAGAVPHFADISPDDLGLDAQRLREHLYRNAARKAADLINRSTNRRIAAVIVMHTFGHPANLDGLHEVCTEFDLPLIEDAAESLGSSRNGRHTGNSGLLGALSFNGNKIVTTGGGGAILTNDPELARRARHLTTTARQAAGWHFVHDEVGYNYRLPNINAALGCAQLERLDAMLARKRRLAARYMDVFADCSGVSILREPVGCRSNYWLNNLLLARASIVERNAILEATNAAGLATRPAWTPSHHLPMYRACPRMDLPVTEDMFERLVSLPSSSFLGPPD